MQCMSTLFDGGRLCRARSSGVPFEVCWQGEGGELGVCVCDGLSGKIKFDVVMKRMTKEY